MNRGHPAANHAKVFAAQVGISRVALSRIENGKAWPLARRLILILATIVRAIFAPCVRARGGFIADADTDPIRVDWLLRIGDRRSEPTEIIFQHTDRQSGRGRRI
ncbi:helix-turn-helix transcriptional regulator [Sphingomonas sp. PP-CE-3A-406]|uniref:helix-turn-helix domain-containing protein n=1 Tax=Sphingomonas sp. PP-CE-3A-406 TaxID=2135659 RepID=UPI000EF9F043